MSIVTSEVRELKGSANVRIADMAAQPSHVGHQHLQSKVVFGGVFMSPRLKQTQLLPAAFGPGEMIGGQFRSPLVEPELLAGDL